MIHLMDETSSVEVTFAWGSSRLVIGVPEHPCLERFLGSGSFINNTGISFYLILSRDP